MHIRKDLQLDTGMPIRWTDKHEDDYLYHTDTLKLELAFHSDNELTEEGYNIILYVTDPSKGIECREAFGISADYDH